MTIISIWGWFSTGVGKHLNSINLPQLEGPSTELRRDKHSWEMMAFDATVSERPCLTVAQVSFPPNEMRTPVSGVLRPLRETPDVTRHKQLFREKISPVQRLGLELKAHFILRDHWVLWN